MNRRDFKHGLGLYAIATLIGANRALEGIKYSALKIEKFGIGKEVSESLSIEFFNRYVFMKK